MCSHPTIEASGVAFSSHCGFSARNDAGMMQWPMENEGFVLDFKLQTGPANWSLRITKLKQ